MSTNRHELIEYYKALDCFGHPSGFEFEAIDFVEALEESEPDGPSGYALVRLKDGRYATFTESQDYTGHG